MGSIYSGIMITDFENELKHANSDIKITNLVNKISNKYGFKFNETSKALCLKGNKKDDMLQCFEDFKREYERLCLINESKEFTDIRLRANLQNNVEEQMG